MRAWCITLLALMACGEKDGVDSADRDEDGDGYTVADGDCDDSDATAFPGGEELCDGVDNDCDGELDEEASDALTFYQDRDGDGFGVEPIEACALPEGAAEDLGDCDDGDADVFPGAEELCNGVDDDCDGEVDEPDASDAATWYADDDGDGFGDPESAEVACDAPSGTVADDQDCDDDDDTVNPDGEELCDGVDNDCNGTVDDDYASDAPTWYADADNDSYGDAASSEVACEAPEGYLADDTDCDDSDALSNPGAEEFCDDADNDCDGIVDWGHRVPSDYSSIQAAIDAVTTGETVCVEAGTYTENLYFSGEEISVQGTWGPDSTIIDGDDIDSVVTFEGNDGDTDELIGFTLTNGDASYGAGVYIDTAAPLLMDLIIEGNFCGGSQSDCYGVGVYAEYGAPVLMDVTIRDNASDSYRVYGVAASFIGAEPTLHRVNVWSNAAVVSNSAFGALSFRGESVGALSNVDVRGNTLTSSDLAASAGVYAFESTVSLDNAIVAGNAATGDRVWGGGVLCNLYATMDLNNVVVHSNTHDGSGESAGLGLYNRGCDVSLTNSVVSGNQNLGSYSDAETAGVSLSASYSPTLTAAWSDVYGNDLAEYGNVTDPTGTDGNLSVDPLFTDVSSADPLDWDFSLQASSTLIDAGDTSQTDPDGTVSDIGAYGGAGAADW